MLSAFVLRLLESVARWCAYALLQGCVLRLMLMWVVVVHLGVLEGIIWLWNAVLFHQCVSDGVIEAILDNR